MRLITFLLAAAVMTAAAATYDPWTVDSTVRQGDSMVIDPSTAKPVAHGAVEVDFDYFQGNTLVDRFTLSVTGCNKLGGTVTLLNQDSGFGIQNWTATGDHSYDLLAVRACNAAALKHQSNI
jgi:hypothetical protein